MSSPRRRRRTPSPHGMNSGMYAAPLSRRERRRDRHRRRDRRRDRDREPLPPGDPMPTPMANSLFLHALRIVVRVRRPPFNISVVSDCMAEIYPRWSVRHTEYVTFHAMCREHETQGHLRLARKGESIVLASSRYEEEIDASSDERGWARKRREEEVRAAKESFNKEWRSNEDPAAKNRSSLGPGDARLVIEGKQDRVAPPRDDHDKMDDREAYEDSDIRGSRRGVDACDSRDGRDTQDGRDVKGDGYTGHDRVPLDDSEKRDSDTHNEDSAMQDERNIRDDRDRNDRTKDAMNGTEEGQDSLKERDDVIMDGPTGPGKSEQEEGNQDLGPVENTKQDAAQKHSRSEEDKKQVGNLPSGDQDHLGKTPMDGIEKNAREDRNVANEGISLKSENVLTNGSVATNEKEELGGEDKHGVSDDVSVKDEPGLRNGDASEERKADNQCTLDAMVGGEGSDNMIKQEGKLVDNDSTAAADSILASYKEEVEREDVDEKLGLNEKSNVDEKQAPEAKSQDTE